jgi:hypothetical protein
MSRPAHTYRGARRNQARRERFIWREIMPHGRRVSPIPKRIRTGRAAAARWAR